MHAHGDTVREIRDQDVSGDGYCHLRSANVTFQVVILKGTCATIPGLHLESASGWRDLTVCQIEQPDQKSPMRPTGVANEAFCCR